MTLLQGAGTVTWCSPPSDSSWKDPERLPRDPPPQSQREEWGRVRSQVQEPWASL